MQIKNDELKAYLNKLYEAIVAVPTIVINGQVFAAELDGRSGAVQFFNGDTIIYASPLFDYQLNGKDLEDKQVISIEIQEVLSGNYTFREHPISLKLNNIESDKATYFKELSPALANLSLEFNINLL
jgi:hypothetical protein